MKTLPSLGIFFCLARFLRISLPPHPHVQFDSNATAIDYKYIKLATSRLLQSEFEQFQISIIHKIIIYHKITLKNCNYQHNTCTCIETHF